MLYYYFTFAFVLLASWAICGLMSVYSPELLIKSSYNIKSETLIRILKLASDDAEAGKDDPDRCKVTKIGIIARFLWLSFLIISLIVLFVAEPTPISEEHKTALLMPALLTTFNQKLAHYINLIFLCIASALYIINSCRLLYKGDGCTRRGTVTAVRVLWCLTALGLLCFGAYISVKSIQLLSFI